MNRVDLNHHVWGYKARTHFYIHSAIRIALSLTILFSILDYVNLSKDAPPKVEKAFVSNFLIFIPVYFCIACAYLVLLLCPNQIWYGICMAFEAAHICFRLYYSTFCLISYGITRTSEDEKRDSLKFYPCGLVAMIIIDFGSILAGIYFCLIMLALSFLYDPRSSSDLYVVRVTSPSAEQATDIAIDTFGNSYISRGKSPDPIQETEEEGSDENSQRENDQEKSKSRKSGKSKRSQKSKKSQKSQKSGKSLKFQKTQEDSGKSKKDKKKENSSKSKSSKSAKSSKSLKTVTEDSVNSEENVIHVAF